MKGQRGARSWNANSANWMLKNDRNRPSAHRSTSASALVLQGSGSMARPAGSLFGGAPGLWGEAAGVRRGSIAGQPGGHPGRPRAPGDAVSVLHSTEGAAEGKKAEWTKSGPEAEMKIVLALLVGLLLFAQSPTDQDDPD